MAPFDISAAVVETIVILVLGVTTYATRAAGFWLAGRFRPSPFFEAWLQQIPGAIFVALVAPMVLTAGLAGWGGAATGFAAMRYRGNFFLAILIGMLTYLLLRSLGASTGVS
ncbi:MAG: AzlD domain-containing protein [Pseudomonadota bacterium]